MQFKHVGDNYNLISGLGHDGFALPIGFPNGKGWEIHYARPIDEPSTTPWGGDFDRYDMRRYSVYKPGGRAGNIVTAVTGPEAHKLWSDGKT
jgi:hypothetical protein